MFNFAVCYFMYPLKKGGGGRKENLQQKTIEEQYVPIGWAIKGVKNKCTPKYCPILLC